MGLQNPQPWSYVTDGERLYEVLKVTEWRQVELEDCGSLTLRRVGIGAMTRDPWQLIKAAPKTVSEEEA